MNADKGRERVKKSENSADVICVWPLSKISISKLSKILIFTHTATSTTALLLQLITTTPPPRASPVPRMRMPAYRSVGPIKWNLNFDVKRTILGPRRYELEGKEVKAQDGPSGWEQHFVDITIRVALWYQKFILWRNFWFDANKQCSATRWTTLYRLSTLCIKCNATYELHLGFKSPWNTLLCTDWLHDGRVPRVRGVQRRLRQAPNLMLETDWGHNRRQHQVPVC